MISATRFAQKMAVLLSRDNKKVWGGIRISERTIKERLGVDHQSIRKWIDCNYSAQSIAERNKEALVAALQQINPSFDPQCLEDDKHAHEFCRMLAIDPCQCNAIIDTRLYADSALLPSFIYPEKNRALEERVNHWVGFFRLYRYGLKEFGEDIFGQTLQVRYLINPSRAYGRPAKREKWLIRCRLNIHNVVNPAAPYRYDGFLRLGDNVADWVFEARSSPRDFVYMITTAAEDRLDNKGTYMSLTQGEHREPRCRPILLRKEMDMLVDTEDATKAHSQIASFMHDTKHYRKEQREENPPPSDVEEILCSLGR